jgi:hypothetical protein
MTEAQRELDLKELGKKVADLERRLQEAMKIKHQPTIREKCPNMSSEAWEIVEKLRNLARDKHSIAVVRSKLDETLAWPNPKAADSEYFYDGQYNNDFTRTTKWFTIMGFKKFDYTYTFTNKWDKDDIKVTFLIPETLTSDDEAHIMWHLMGEDLYVQQ